MTTAERGGRLPASPAPLRPTLEDACRRWAARPAITFEGVTITYAQLWEQITALAGAYARLGVRPGHRLLCQLRNCPEHVAAAAAAWERGAVHVGADNDLTGRELARLVERLAAAVLLYQPPQGGEDPLAPLQAVAAVSAHTHLVVHGADGDAGLTGTAPRHHRLARLLTPPERAPVPGEQAAPLDPAILFLTSGTTGEPKAVVESLAAHWAKMQLFADGFAPDVNDVHLLFLPVAHVFGFRLALLALLRGGRLVLLDRFSPERALDLIGQEQVTVLPAVPAHLRLLREHFDPSRHDLRSLRWVLSAASNLPTDLARWVYTALDARMLYVYGCSEGFTMLTNERADILAGSVGSTVFKGPPGTPADGTVRVVDPRTGTALPAGVTGEIWFGAATPVRYWDQPDTATDGWYRTGDLGHIDDEGRVHITGRLKELVNRAGLHVSAAEVETALVAHPAVADAAIIATPDPVLGEAVCACVVPSGAETVDLPKLRSFLAPNLARHKLPDELCVVDGIPRTVIGKVDRAALAEQVLHGGRHRERLRS